MNRPELEPPKPFKALLERVEEIIALVAADGSISYCNPATTSMLGVAVEGPARRALWEFVHPEDLARGRGLFGTLLERPAGETATVELRLQAETGWRSVEFVARRLDDPPHVHFVLNGRDVTATKGSAADLRDREKQLRQAQKMETVGRLASGIAHDFRNLLTVVLGASERIVEGLPDDHPLKKHAESVYQSALRASDLTERLLTFSRRQELSPSILNLNDVVDGAAPLIRTLIGERIELRTSYADDLRLVCVDRTQMEQVLLNLAVNARDAMSEGGQLTIETRNVEARELPSPISGGAQFSVMMSVADTGIGMSVETQARAFEPFFTTKEVGRGSGLGLSTVYAIVKQSQGSVVLDSHPGSGTRIKLYFPAVESAEPTSWETTEAVDHPVGGVETVLVVEDEEDVRDIVQELLGGAGYRVLSAAKPSIAQRIGLEFAGVIHLLLTDVVMPEMSGPELAARLVDQRPVMKVLYMSGHPDRSTAGGNPKVAGDLIPKPFTRRSLLARVREVLDTDASVARPGGAEAP